jgi:hypothetical protein
MYVKGRYSHVYIIRQFCYQLLLLSYKDSTKNILHFWYIIWSKINIKVFSSANGKGQVSYCHHFASVIFVGLRRELFTFVPTFLKLNYRTKAWRNGSLVVDPFQNCVRLVRSVSNILQIDESTFEITYETTE